MKRSLIRGRSRDGAALKELDRLCRQVTFARDGHCCMHCGSAHRTQWCHVYTRSIRSMRWTLANTMTLCAGCHLWWHHRPNDAVAWWTGRVGTEGARRLSPRAARPTKRRDRAAMTLYLRSELKRLDAGRVR